jgi:recombinational DNA repair protein (RecF pathway)
MAAPSINTEGIVLSKEDSGESHRRHFILSPSEGGILCMHRSNIKNNGATNPDLFDEGQAFFIKDYRLIRRHTEIGTHYKSFQYACDLSNVIRKNMLHAESFHHVYNLFIKALTAFEKHKLPEVVFLKSLYLFARDEGYPVKEQWLQHLDKNLQNQAIAILSNPIESCNFSDEMALTLIDSFKHWMIQHTDIIL